MPKHSVSKQRRAKRKPQNGEMPWFQNKVKVNRARRDAAYEAKRRERKSKGKRK